MTMIADWIGSAPSELLVATAFLLVIIVCAYSWIRYREYAALAYVLPSIYMGGLYLWIWYAQPPDEWRRSFVRLGLVLFAAVIIIARRDFILRRRRRDK